MTDGSKWRVVVVDDHPIFRRGLTALLRSTGLYEVVGEAETVPEIMPLVHETEPDIALLDVRLGSASSLAIIHALRKTLPKVKVVVLTVFDAPAFRRVARAAGAHGFVTKLDADVKLRDVLSTVLAGKNAFDDELCADEHRTLLTDRELEVVRDVVYGHTNRGIAERIGISVKSVESYRARSMKKLGLSTRVELVRYALEVGLVEAPSRVTEDV